MKKLIKTTFISTVFNEEKTIKKFFDSLFFQTKLPNEIIIVDGGSRDATVSSIKYQVSRASTKDKRLRRIKFKILVKEGNRSVGRNEAIKHATGDIILCSDAGNILDKNWIKEITKPFIDSSVDVVAGYYQGKTKNIFQKCLVPFALVMPDKVNPDMFLPATRSIAFTKKIWKKVGGFDVTFSHNEDYVFANRLKENKAKIVFAKDAIVNWIPRDTYKQAFIMFFRFALGDAEAEMWRTKVLLLFMRYSLGFYLVYVSFYYKSFVFFTAIFVFAISYLLWSIWKNYHYVKDRRAYAIIPFLQLTADVAVITGTIMGLLKRLRSFVARNKFLSAGIFLYTFFVVIVLSWGVPNIYHPFPYHMDEWHQLMAMKAIIKHGTTTISGSAEIPFVYPVLSGIYLIPFTLFHFINPFDLKSPLENLLTQQKLFEILRSVNIFFGVGSILFTAKIAKDYLKINNWFTAIFFITSPAFLLLSTYFKYDVCLLFWITFSVYLMLKFGATPTLKNYLFASFVCAIATGTKFSAIPLLPLLIFSLFWFTHKRSFKHLFLGLIIYAITFLIVGVPSFLIGTANYIPLLQANLVDTPNMTSNFILPYHWFIYLLINQYPLLFGHSLFILSLLASLFLFYKLILKRQFKLQKNKVITFLFLCFILFFMSLIPLKIWATRNRSLVLLPFLVLIAGWFVAYVYTKFHSKAKYLISIIVAILIVAQFYEAGAWLYAKYKIDPQKDSSVWIKNNIPRGTTIGVEEIVIYQSLPNIVVKEFYLDQYKKQNSNLYTYQIVNSKSKKLPSVVVVSDADVTKKTLVISPKNDLVRLLERNGYKKLREFAPDTTYLKLFTDDVAYYLAGNAANPTSITVYKKN